MKRTLTLICFLLTSGLFNFIMAQTWNPLLHPAEFGGAMGMRATHNNSRITTLHVTDFGNYGYGITPLSWDGNQWHQGTTSDPMSLLDLKDILVTGDSLWVLGRGLLLYHANQWSFFEIPGHYPAGISYATSLDWFNNQLYVGGGFCPKLQDSTWYHQDSLVALISFDGNNWSTVSRFTGFIRKVETIGERLYMCGNFTDTLSGLSAGFGYLEGTTFHVIDDSHVYTDFVKTDQGYYLRISDFCFISLEPIGRIFFQSPSGLQEITTGQHLYTSVMTMMLFDQKLVIAGCFEDTAAGGQMFTHVAALDHHGNLYRMGDGLNGMVNDLAVFNNTLAAAGGFTSGNNQPPFFTAIWSSPFIALEKAVVPIVGDPYPNPSGGMMHIPVSGERSTIEVYSLSGRLVHHEKVSGLNAATYHMIDLSKLPAGMYMMVSSNDSTQKAWRVMLTH